MDIEKLEYRMYGLTPYQLTGIQIGIQYGHAVVEYGDKYSQTEEYKLWSKNYKTFIILNGGTTNTNVESLGTMNQHLQTLIDNKILCDTFYEPDLGDQLTAVVFIVDERVFNKEKWTEYDGLWYDEDGKVFTSGRWDRKPNEYEYRAWLENFSKDEKEVEKILFLRNFLKSFRLA